MAARELIALINTTRVGRLREENDLWTFQYEPQWITSEHAFDLSPHLPRSAGRIVDGASKRPVQWFFDNLLPEEKTRDVLAREAKVDGSDAFGMLAYYGRESAGAITLQTQEEPEAQSGYVFLSDEELHERIAKLPKQSLSVGAPKHMSNAGGQHKLAVCIREGQLYHPVGNTPSTWLLKPDHEDKENWPSSAANEYFTMRLAAHLGLSVPEVAIRFVPDPVYLIRRFDRVHDAEPVQRLHAIDACQLLGLNRQFKYQQAGVDALIACIEQCANPARSRMSILQWTLFNLLIGNADAHLKNLSFLVRPSGIELAPFYDLVSTESYHACADNDPRWPHHELTMRIGDASTFSEVNAENFLAFAEQLRVNRRASTRLLERFTRTIDGAASQLCQAYEALPVPQNQRAGQLRVLRTIHIVVIREMIERLRSKKSETP
ncbi:HipA domain-containing protein [Steroidobacter sp. S1-65]|uniref:HipA domain-containing protein n=1 Tax=Steroidobacter gossypii TaxID=2805490 RepID=A0ABS1WXW0_9GAMM|nr:HipA domain-containing protein [Steroidobacter gossypii]MBM0105820.1 HipA domain-containing protein [Steroidobacter gossypii]